MTDLDNTPTTDLDLTAVTDLVGPLTGDAPSVQPRVRRETAGEEVRGGDRLRPLPKQPDD